MARKPPVPIQTTAGASIVAASAVAFFRPIGQQNNHLIALFGLGWRYAGVTQNGGRRDNGNRYNVLHYCRRDNPMRDDDTG